MQMGLLLIVFALIAAVPVVFIVDGLLTGEVQAKGGCYSRTEEPGWFWTMIGVYIALLGGIAFLALDLAFSEWA